MNDVLLASTDPALFRRAAPGLAAAGLHVVNAATNLELAWNIVTRGADAVVLDARRRAFGVDPLRWLSDDARCPTNLVVLTDVDDEEALAEAERASASAVIAGRLRPGRIVSEVLRVLRGRHPRELFRWTPPRNVARIGRSSAA